MDKLPFKRVEIPLSKFNDVAIPHHLELLQKHKHNIKMYQIQHEWDRVRIEQNNASRLIKQLKQLLYEMEMLRSQVQKSDWPKFDQHTIKSRQTVQNVITEYLVLIKKTASIQKRAIEFDDSSEGLEESGESSDGQFQLVVNDVEHQTELLKEREACLRSAQQLQEDLQDINQIFIQLQAIVHEQGEHVDHIETQVESANENVHGGAIELVKAAGYKRAMYPLTGAAIGTCVGGPIGCVAGLKIGSLAALGCGLTGYFGGRFLKETSVVTEEPVVNKDQEESRKNKLL